MLIVPVVTTWASTMNVVEDMMHACIVSYVIWVEHSDIQLIVSLYFLKFDTWYIRVGYMHVGMLSLHKTSGTGSYTTTTITVWVIKSFVPVSGSLEWMQCHVALNLLLYLHQVSYCYIFIIFWYFYLWFSFIRRSFTPLGRRQRLWKFDNPSKNPQWRKTI